MSEKAPKKNLLENVIVGGVIPLVVIFSFIGGLRFPIRLPPIGYWFILFLGILLLGLTLYLSYTKDRKGTKKIVWSLVFTCFVILPCWIIIGGIDCKTPDDADLLLPQSDETYTEEENGWTILSNVLSRVEAIEDGLDSSYKAFTLAKDKLLRYVDPTNQTWVIESRDDCSTNIISSCDYVESCLKSNDWLCTGIDATLAAPVYVSPPLASPLNGYPCLSVVEMHRVNRSFLLAHVKCEIEKGNIDTAVECYGKNLRLATLLQTQCGCLLEYLAGAAMIKDDVLFLERELDDATIPHGKLQAFDNLLKNLPGLMPEATAHALKREYAYYKEFAKLKPTDVVLQNKSGLVKLLLSPFVRYVFNPNRSLHAMAELTRDAIKGTKKSSYEKNAYNRISWIDVIGVFGPNHLGRRFFTDHIDYREYLNDVNEITEKVASVRCKIAERLKVSHYNGTLTSKGEP